VTRTVSLTAPTTLLLLISGLAFAHGPGISMTHTSFDPAEISVPVGQVVHFTCLESVPRGLQVVADDGGFQSPRLARGEGFHHTFEKPGTYPYHLQQDPSVRGTIVVEPAKE
jgi:plastocyanin